MRLLPTFLVLAPAAALAQEPTPSPPPPPPAPTPAPSGFVETAAPAPIAEAPPERSMFSVAIGGMGLSPIGTLENVAELSFGGRVAVGVRVSRTISVIGALEYLALSAQSFANVDELSLIAGGIGLRVVPERDSARPYVEGTIGPRTVRVIPSSSEETMSVGGLGVSLSMGVEFPMSPTIALAVGAGYSGSTDPTSAASGITFQAGLQITP